MTQRRPYISILLRIIAVCVCFLICLTSGGIKAQVGHGVFIHSGSIIPNNVVFPEVKSPSLAVEYRYTNETTAKKMVWPAYYGYPTLGVGVIAQTMGNDDVLGRAYGVMPSLTFHLIRKEKFSLGLGAGLGVAASDRPYDKLDNPTNNIIGSPVNAFGMSHLLTQYQVASHWQLQGGISVHHYSNGNLTSPNIGANLASITLGLIYQAQPNAKRQEKPDDLPEVNKRIKAFVRGGFGLTEKQLDGPKYPAYMLSAGVSRRMSRISTLSTGFEIVYNEQQRRFLEHVEPTADNARRQATRYVWIISHELGFGHLSLLTEGGLYLGKHYGQRSPFSSKVGFLAYPVNILKHNGPTPYAGIAVRAYFGEAELVECMVGVRF